MCEHTTNLPEEGSTGIIRCTGRDGQIREFRYGVAIVEQNYETNLCEWTFHTLNPHDPNVSLSSRLNDALDI
jgi:GH15 family glucan-1,4-alpha-glucosidase